MAIGLVFLAGIGAFAYEKFQRRRIETLIGAPSGGPAPEYRCDGRTYCSQMTSCAEAQFFLKHCPDTKMDGNRDGIPCQEQWCN